MKESIEEFSKHLSIDKTAILNLLKRNLTRWKTHLESTQFDIDQQMRAKNNIDSFLTKETSKLNQLLQQ